MTTKRAKIPKLADKANSVNATYLSSTVNIDYIDQRTTGLNIFRLTSVTYSGTFPPGVGAGSMNGSILTEYVWDGNAGEQQLFHFGLNKWYWRIRGGGTFGVWREILDSAKLGLANGIAGLNNNAEIEASLLQNVIYPKLNVAYASNGNNSLLESLIASGVYSNIFKHVSLGAVTYSAEFSSDGTTWIDVSNDVNLKKVMFGTEDAYFQMGKGSSLSLLFTCAGSIYDTLEFLRFTGGFSADTFIEINGVLNSSTTDEFTDILSCNSLTSSTGPGAIILRHKRIALHSTNSSMYKKLRVVIKQGTTVNGSLQELGWYGYYQQGLRKLPTHDFVTNYLRDTYFPRNVYTANGNFIGNLQGKSTSSGVTDSGSAGNTDLHSVYEGCPVGFSNVRLLPSVVTNLPPGFGNALGCTLQCIKYDVSTGYMIFIPMGNKSMYTKYKNAGVGNYGEWKEIGSSGGSSKAVTLNVNYSDLTNQTIVNGYLNALNADKTLLPVIHFNEGTFVGETMVEEQTVIGEVIYNNDTLFAPSIFIHKMKVNSTTLSNLFVNVMINFADSSTLPTVTSELYPENTLNINYNMLKASNATYCRQVYDMLNNNRNITPIITFDANTVISGTTLTNKLTVPAQMMYIGTENYIHLCVNRVRLDTLTRNYDFIDLLVVINPTEGAAQTIIKKYRNNSLMGDLLTNSMDNPQSLGGETIYLLYDGTSGTKPDGVTDLNNSILKDFVYSATTGYGFQILECAQTEKIYTRIRNNNVWTTWKELGGSGSTYSEYLINIQDLIGSDGLAKTAELRDKIVNHRAYTNFIAYLPIGSYTGANGASMYNGSNTYIPVQIIILNSGEYQILLKSIATGSQTGADSKRFNIILDNIYNSSIAKLYIYEDTDFIELDYNALRNYGSYGTWLQRQLDDKPNYPIMCKVAKNTQIATNPNIFVGYDSVSHAQYFAGQICIPILYYGSGNPLYRCEMYISNFSTGTTSDISVIVHDKGQGI